MSLPRPHNIKTTSLIVPNAILSNDIISDIKTTSLIRPLLGSPKGGLNIEILSRAQHKSMLTPFFTNSLFAVLKT